VTDGKVLSRLVQQKTAVLLVRVCSGLAAAAEHTPAVVGMEFADLDLQVWEHLQATCDWHMQQGCTSLSADAS
jgi:hypothetical protein